MFSLNAPDSALSSIFKGHRDELFETTCAVSTFSMCVSNMDGFQDYIMEVVYCQGLFIFFFHFKKKNTT